MSEDPKNINELKKIISSVVITAIIGGFSTYVQVAKISTEVSHIQKQLAETNRRLEVVPKHSTDLEVRGLWMQGIDAIIAELRANNVSLQRFSQENRDRIIQNEFKIKTMENQK